MQTRHITTDSGRRDIETAEVCLCYLRVNSEEASGSLESSKNGFQSPIKLDRMIKYHIINFDFFTLKHNSY